MKNISILGSTGSIGKQTIDIVLQRKDINVLGLTANTNIDMIEEQISLVNPKVVAIMDEKKAVELKERVGHKVRVVAGMDGIIEVATLDNVETVITAVVGMIGIRPTVEAIKAGKNIALANKETLVAAGQIIMKMVKEYNVTMLPIDSEHSALFQCLNGENKNDVNKLILTASGGPFRGKKAEDLVDVSAKEALNHPNWSMGSKISIDSATLMNKGLEVIEAKWLYDVPVKNIDVVIHPQSIIHSMVEFKDGSIMAQLGVPDMRIPIQYALYYPNRLDNNIPKLDITKIAQLNFEAPDKQAFRCLQLAYNAIGTGGSLPTVLNAANEVAVSKFLNNKIRFLEIPELIEYAMDKHHNILNPSLEDIYNIEAWTYEIIESRW